MKLSNLNLFESVDEENIAKLIKRDCKKVLNFFKKHDLLFYRGIRGKYLCQKETTLLNRKPRDSSTAAHDVYNNALKQFGGYQWRSESLFVAADDMYVEDYGNIHVVFPIGNFEVLYSPAVIDPYDAFDVGGSSGHGVWMAYKKASADVRASIDNLITNSTLMQDMPTIFFNVCRFISKDIIADYPDTEQFLSDDSLRKRINTVLKSKWFETKFGVIAMDVCTNIIQNDSKTNIQTLTYFSKTTSKRFYETIEKIISPLKNKNAEAYDTFKDETIRLNSSVIVTGKNAANNTSISTDESIRELYQSIFNLLFADIYKWIERPENVSDLPAKFKRVELMMRCKEYYIVDIDTYETIKTELGLGSIT